MNLSNGFSIRSMDDQHERMHLSNGRFEHPHGPRYRRVLTRILNAFSHAARWVWHQKEILGWKRLLLRSGGIAFLLFLLYIGFLWITLPNIENPASLLASQSTVITDRNGVELYRLYAEEDRTYVPGSQIADVMEKAVVAIEDERFYEHGCIEVRSIVRAVFARLVGANVSGGASTLTQQLARNALLTREQTITRKLKEAMLACELERRFDKDKLLELYLNWIPWGQNAYGIEQASRRYFGVSAKDLTLPQAAVLASIPQRPSYFNPYGPHARTTVTADAMKRITNGDVTSAADINSGDVRIGLLGAMVGTGTVTVYIGGRSDQVLHNMQKQGFIKEAERLQALEDLKTLKFKPYRENIRAPHFVLWVKEQVESFLEEHAEKDLLQQGGLTIQTTLDWKIQQAAEEAIASKKDDILKVYGARNISLVALDPKTGEVVAYVGNVDYAKDENETKVDMALSPRQPGSSFKPFVYAAAFQKGYAPATVLYDVSTKFGNDQPQNFDGKFWGLMNARQALGASRNIPAIKAFFLAGGEQPILDLVESMGVTSPKRRKAELSKGKTFDYGWPLAIGAAETPLIEMVQGYSTLADGGRFKPITSITRITDQHGALLPLPQNEEGQEVLDPRLAYQVTSILSDVSIRPNEYWKSVLSVPGFQAAAKTGTSNKCLDRNEKNGVCKLRKPDNVWTIGYTPALVSGVWVGNATSEALSDKADGLNVAAPIWKDFMVRAHKIMKGARREFPVPPGIVEPQISLLSGELPTECTPVNFRRADLFLSEKAPTVPDSACAALTVDRLTGLLASDNCPSEAQETRSFFVPRSVLADRWPLWEEGVQAWARKQGGSGSALPLPLAPSEKCDVSKTPGRLIKPSVSILSPENNGVASYPSFQPQISYSVGSSASGATFILDGKVLSEDAPAPFRPVLRVPRSINKDGTHTLEVILRDAYYNTAKSSVTFRFTEDTGSPDIRITEPNNGDTFSSGDLALEIRANANDSEGGIKYVEFFLDDLLLTRKPQEPYELNYSLDSVEPGLHRLRVVATDLAGRTSDDEVTIVVEE